MDFRNSHPSRTLSVPLQQDYKKYREQLRNDFNCRCGYCNALDKPRVEQFEVDHFVPQKIAPNLKSEYSNLVYACRSCNNSKRDKWPTNNPEEPNDGTIGWIDPCNIEYANQFERGEYGEIIPLTDLGTWMYKELKLWKKQHEILYCYEEIGNSLKEILVHLNNIHDEESLKAIIRIQSLQNDIINKLYI